LLVSKALDDEVSHRNRRILWGRWSINWIGEVGFDILLGFDLDKKCVETLTLNSKTIRHKTLQSDVKDMLGGKLLKHAKIGKGELDLLAGGPPCQGFSVQRTIGGDRDARNLLVDDYGDLIAEAEPRFFLMENVPGIGGKRGREIVDRFKDRMTEIGYFATRKFSMLKTMECRKDDGDL